MVVSNIPTTNGVTVKGAGKGKAKEILVDPASLASLESADKNVQMNAVVHPKLYHAFIVNLAQEPSNVSNDGTKAILTRKAYSNAIRRALAAAAGYTGDLLIEGTRGGNVIGIVSAFNTTVGSMFELARSMGAMTNMPEEQIKAFAFSKAKESVGSHPQLQGVEVTDEVLEKLWSGAELELDLDEDEDEDEDEA